MQALSLSGPISGPVFRLMTPWVIASSCLFTLLRQSLQECTWSVRALPILGHPNFKILSISYPTLLLLLPTICPGHVWILQPDINQALKPQRKGVWVGGHRCGQRGQVSQALFKLGKRWWRSGRSLQKSVGYREKGEGLSDHCLL